MVIPGKNCVTCVIVSDTKMIIIKRFQLLDLETLGLKDLQLEELFINAIGYSMGTLSAEENIRSIVSQGNGHVHCR